MRPPSSVPLRHVMADDARVVLVAVLVGSFTSMPKPFMKPWSRRTSTVGWFFGEVEEDDLGVLGLVAERRLGPCADQLAGLEVVGGEGRVGGVDRVERRVERDHQEAGVARLLDRRHDRRGVARRDQDALGAGGDQVLDRRDLAVVVAVDTCRRRL